MNLIIQATYEILPSQIKTISGLTSAIRTEQISSNAYRLVNVHHHDGVASYCWEEHLDYGYVRPNQKLTDFGMVVMDMDSTLITIECIDEIADMHGIKHYVSSITESAMRRDIDFAESLLSRVALLEGLDESVLQRVYDERLQLSPGTDILLAALKQNSIKTMLISNGFEFFTERLSSRLGLDFAYANTLEIINGKLSGKVFGEIMDAKGKADKLVQTRDQLSLNGRQVIAIGDGANDLKMMSQASVSIAYHAKAVVRSQATYAFNFVGLDGLIPLFSG